MAYFAMRIAQSIINNLEQFAILALIGAIPAYLVTILAFVTFVRRIKSHTLLRNSICYRIIIKIIEFIKNMKITFRTAILYFMFGFITTILILERDSGWNL